MRLTDIVSLKTYCFIEFVDLYNDYEVFQKVANR